jgi:hypothetical protein
MTTDAAMQQLIASVAQASTGGHNQYGRLPGGATDPFDAEYSRLLGGLPPSNNTMATSVSSSATVPGQGINTVPLQLFNGQGDANALQAAAYLLSATANSMMNVYAQQQQQHRPTNSHIPQSIPGNISGDILAALLASSTSQQPQPMTYPPAVLNSPFFRALFPSGDFATQTVAPSAGPVAVQQVSGVTSETSHSDSKPPARPQHPLLTNRSPIPLVMEYDEQVLNEYQCLLRKQIELFETGPDDVKGKAQGRNTPVQIGQVGIRCRHCVSIPRSARPKGSAYYSRTLVGMYQVSVVIISSVLALVTWRAGEARKKKLMI